MLRRESIESIEKAVSGFVEIWYIIAKMEEKERMGLQ